MTPAPFYLWRYVRGKPAELVAIVNDEEMALQWWASPWCAAGEWRSWTRFSVGAP